MASIAETLGAAAVSELSKKLFPAVADLMAGIIHKHATQAQSTPVPDEQKLAAVIDKTKVDLRQAVADGKIPAVPPPDIVAAAVQASVSTLKVTGALPSSKSQPAADSQSGITIPIALQSVTITIAGQTFILKP
jgi:hypothetical protein